MSTALFFGFVFAAGFAFGAFALVLGTGFALSAFGLVVGTGFAFSAFGLVLAGAVAGFYILVACSFPFCGGVTDLLEAGRDLGRICLCIVVCDSDCLVGKGGLDVLDAFLKAEIGLDFVLAVLAGHLRVDAEDRCLVFGVKAEGEGDGHEGRKE